MKSIFYFCTDYCFQVCSMGLWFCPAASPAYIPFTCLFPGVGCPDFEKGLPTCTHRLWASVNFSE